jgi:simple sugar transport system permease protein
VSGRLAGALREMGRSSWLVTLAAMVVALAFGAILVAAADPAVQATAGRMLTRPGDFLGAVWNVVSGAYTALFQGAVFNPHAKGGLAGSLAPFANTLTNSVPLIFAGLGIALGFRAGLFNIGAQGQIILGAIACAWVSFAWHMPPVLHLVAGLAAAIAGGALWGFVPGILKAKTGANEVIVTIMLNSVAVYLVAYLLTLKAFQRPDSNNPKSPIIDPSAQFPLIFGARYSTHLGFAFAIAAAIGVWWLLERSTLGLKLRAVGAGPAAARTAGIHVERVYVAVMVIAGALAGLAASAQIQGTEKVLTAGVAASFGFDAITVALLGRSRPLGTFLAGLLFGGLRAGGYLMQASTGTPIDVVLVLQSVVVLLIAAPPLVRAVFRLPGGADAGAGEPGGSEPGGSDAGASDAGAAGAGVAGGGSAAQERGAEA